VDRPGGIIGDTADRNGRQAVADKPLRLGEAMRKHWPEYLMEAWGRFTAGMNRRRSTPRDPAT
jgi:hypothetical protein